MLDRETIIKAIEDCVFHKIKCVDCINDGCVFDHGDCKRDLLADALAMMKEQEDEIAFLKKMQLQTVHNMREGDIGEAVARILHLGDL